MDNTFKIHSFKWSTFQDLIEKINKKAKRLNLPEVSFVEIGRQHFPAIEVWECVEFGGVHTKPRPAYDLIEVKIAGETPFIQGWALVGVLEHTPDFGSVIVHSVPEQTVPVEYREAAPVCDHCGHNRLRKDTFVLKNVSTGEHKQIGRNCLSYFLPGVSPSEAAALCSFYSEPIFRDSTDCEDFNFYEGSVAVCWDHADIDLIRLWSITHAVMRNRGWVSKAISRETGQKATADLVHLMICPPAWGFMSQDERKEYERLVRDCAPTEADKGIADKTMFWLKNEVGSSDDYLHNLKVIAKTGFVNSRNLPLAVSAVGSYLRYFEAQERRKERKEMASEWQGEVGKRMRGLLLEVYTVKCWDSQFGTVTFVGFKDTSGNIYTWKASKFLDVERGQKYLVTGTVKEHAEYKGSKQTTLQRCILSNIPETQVELPLNP